MPDRLETIEKLLRVHDKLLSTLTGEDEKEKRLNRDRLMNLDDDNVPSLQFKITAGQMTAAISAQASATNAYIALQLQGYNTKAEISQYIDDTMSQISLVASGIFSGSFPIVIGTQSPTYSATMTAVQALAWAKANVAANSQLFYNNTAATLNGAYEVLKPTGGFLNTKVYQWNGSAWGVFADARRTDSIGNPVDYAGQYAYITTEHSYGTPSVTYYANKLYRSGNGLWTEVISGDGYVSAASIIAAVNADGSTLKFTADKVNITGYLTISDFDGSSTFIDGAAIETGTLYADSLAKVDDGTGYDYIAMQNGFDFRNSTYMNFTESGYSPYSRAVQGLHAISFNGDTSLTQDGFGMTGNAPTPVAGYVQNRQSMNGSNVTQYGLDVGGRQNVRIMGQCFGLSAGGEGVYVYSLKPDAVASGDTFFELRVIDTGIYAYKVQYSGGTYNTLGSATILS